MHCLMYKDLYNMVSKSGICCIKRCGILNVAYTSVYISIGSRELGRRALFKAFGKSVMCFILASGLCWYPFSKKASLPQKAVQWPKPLAVFSGLILGQCRT